MIDDNTAKSDERNDNLPDHESGVRRMMADASGTAYVALRTLSDAQAFEDAFVILEGDYGGIIYATCPAQLVRCSEESLSALLNQIDSVIWSDDDGARVFYERRDFGPVAGGMGGGEARNSLWVHPELEKGSAGIRDRISEVLGLLGRTPD